MDHISECCLNVVCPHSIPNGSDFDEATLTSKRWKTGLADISKCSLNVVSTYQFHTTIRISDITTQLSNCLFDLDSHF